MSKRNSFVVVVLIGLVALQAGAASLGFEQISWLDNAGGYVSRFSDWGQVQISLGSADDGLFYTMTVQTGYGQLVTGRGGYMNIVTDAGGSADWDVQNLPFFYENPIDLDGRLPQGVWFDLGVTPGTPLSSLNYYYTIDPAPLASMPAGTLTSLPVTEFEQFLSGDMLWLGPNPPQGGGLTAPPAAQNFEGAAAGEHVGWVGSISVPETSIGAVNEDDNGCAPGAVARSIKYMSDNHSNVNVPATTQQVYGALRTAMKTTAAGTMTDNILSGKNAYVAANNLPIMSTQTQSFQAAMDTLNRNGDVELGVAWGTGADGKSLGGHRTFVSEVQELQDSSGNVTGYVVRTIDDPEQGDGKAENSTHTMKFDANGNLVQYDGGAPPGTGGGLINFQIEDVRADMTDLAFRYGPYSIYPMPPEGPPSPIHVDYPGKPSPVSGVKVTHWSAMDSGNPGSLFSSQLVLNPDTVPDPSDTMDMDLMINLTPGDPAAPTFISLDLGLGHVQNDEVTPGRFMPILSEGGEVMLESLVMTSSFFDITYQIEMPGAGPQVYRLHGSIAEELLGTAWFLGQTNSDPDAWVDSFFDVFFEIELSPEAYELLLIPDSLLVNLQLFGQVSEIYGDANADGFIGSDDLVTILTYWGMTGASREQGDLTGDEFVGVDDYVEVLTYWGNGTPPLPPEATPEPATLSLLLVVSGLALLRRGR